MRANEQETGSELAARHEGGVMDGRGLRGKLHERGKTHKRAHACFIHLSFLRQSLL